VVWHLIEVWKVREDPDLYDIAVALCGGEHRLWVTICRQLHVQPKHGLKELLHWDVNMFRAWLMSFSGGAPEIEDVGFQGKFVYQDAKFVCVVGTHTDPFTQKSHDAYEPHYDQLWKNHEKFGLTTDKPDPFSLFEKKVVLDVPRGCCVLWHRKLLHGQEENKSGEVLYGSFIGFNGAVSRAAYKDASGVDELTDRLASFEQGRPPICYGSCDKVRVFPENWKSKGKRMLEAAVKKLPVNHASIYEHVQQNGTRVKYLKFLPQTNYEKPTLSDLGKRLLGQLPYDEAESTTSNGAAAGPRVVPMSNGGAGGAAGGSRVKAEPNRGDTESDEDEQAGAPLKKQCRSGLTKEDACDVSD
jgi:hypothetical protein